MHYDAAGRASSAMLNPESESEYIFYIFELKLAADMSLCGGPFYYVKYLCIVCLCNNGP